MRIGVLSFVGVHASDTDRAASLRFQEGVVAWLREQEHDVVVADDLAVSAASVAPEAERLGRADCDSIVFCFATESDPGLPPQAALRVSCPILLLGSADPAGGGMAALFAAAGALGEVGAPCGRVLGNVDDAAARSGIAGWLRQHDRKTRQRGRDAAQTLYGTRCALLGNGAAAGAEPDPSQWLSQFGVTLERFAGADIAERARRVEPDRVQAGIDWLTANVAEIRYDGDRLTPGPAGTLARQVRTYLAIRDLCRDEQIAFCALADRIDPDVAPGLILSLLNDGNDWEGATAPLVSAPGGDANGALTMRLLHLVSGNPALCGALRGYDAQEDLVGLAGAVAPTFAGLSEETGKKWPRVVLRAAPVSPDAAAGGSLHFDVATSPEVTFARLARLSGRFICVMTPGAFVEVTAVQGEALPQPATAGTAPHTWARFECPHGALVRTWPSSHVHAAVGDHVGALRSACESLGITPIHLSRAS